MTPLLARSVRRIDFLLRGPVSGLLYGLIAFFALLPALYAQSVQTYDLDKRYLPGTPTYSVDVSGIAVPVAFFQPPTSTETSYYFAHFSFSGNVTVKVTATSKMTSPTVSPLAFNLPLTPSTDGTAISFPLSTSSYLIVSNSGHPPLILAADPPENAPDLTKVLDVTSTKYGASPTASATVNTTAIQNAINAAAGQSGGGIVYVPKGVYQISHLILKSKVTLYLNGSAVLRAADVISTGNATDSGNFPNDFNKSTVQANGTYMKGGTFLVSTDPAGTDGAAIRGRGWLDGNGYYLRHNQYWLTTLIVPRNSTNFSVDGIVGWDGGFWAFTPAVSNGTTITNYKGMQDLKDSDMSEDDGIDVCDSSQVTVQHAIVASRDDSYSTKVLTVNAGNDVGQNWVPASKYPATAPDQDILFSDVVAWSFYRTFKIGNSDDMAQTGITFDHGYAYSAQTPISVDTIYGGQPASDIVYSNIDVETSTATWLEIIPSGLNVSNVDLFHVNVRNASTTTPSVTSGSSVSNVLLSDVVVNGSRIVSNSGLPSSFSVRPYVMGDPIPATAWSSQQGTVSNPVAGGGSFAGGGKNGAYVEFDGLDFGSGMSATNNGTPLTQLTLATSTPNSNGSIQVAEVSSGNILGTAVLPNNGSWFSPTALTFTMADPGNQAGLVQGQHNVRFNFANNSTSTVANLYTVQPLLQVRQAEAYANLSGSPTAQSCGANCSYMGSITNGSWLSYTVQCGTGGVSTIYVRAGSLRSGSVEIHDGSPTGTLLGTMPVPVTGSWITFENVPVPLGTTLTGQHVLYFVGVRSADSASFVNLDSFSF